MSKQRILFLNRAPNESHMNDMAELFDMSFIGPLGELGVADFEVLWVGPFMDQVDDAPLDWEIFRKCIEYRPDVMYVYGWWLHFDDKTQAGYPALFTLYLIRNLLNIKIVVLLFDQSPQAFSTSDQIVRFCDFAFTHEYEGYFNKHSLFPHKHILNTATFSPSLFNGDPLGIRSIKVAFVGGLGGYPEERIQGINALKESGIPIETPGGRGEGQKRLSNEEYAAFFKKSQIVVNWSRHISKQWFQAKARIFEATLTGAMLLCEECEPVNVWFRPYIDYVPFTGVDDLVDKARYYLSHDEERLKIAEQGHRVAHSKYSAGVIWSDMINHMENTSFYDEKEAVEGLRLNASGNELRVAKFFGEKLQNEDEYDLDLVRRAIGIVQKGNKSIIRRVRWAIRHNRKRSRSILPNLHWKIVRAVIPKSITRKSVSNKVSSIKQKFR